MNHKHKTKTVPPASAGATTTPVKSAKTSKGAASTDSQIRIKHSPARSNNGADKAKAAKPSVVTAPTTAMPSEPKRWRPPVGCTCVDGNRHDDPDDFDEVDYQDADEEFEADEADEEFDEIDFWLPPFPADQFDFDVQPTWVQKMEDKSVVKYDIRRAFFYATPEDHSCGISHVSKTSPKPYRRLDFDFGPYGIAQAADIGGELWVSLPDSGKIAGITADRITGFRRKLQSHDVRGEPGYLNPDGIRNLSPQGICAEGIRLEALVRHVEENRRADPRVLAMLKIAIAGTYDGAQATADTAAISRIDLWRGVGKPHTTGQISQNLFYDPLRGEFATVGIGTQPWFWVESISSYTGLDPANLVRIAGKARTLEIPDSMVYPLVDTGGKKTYIRGDFVEKLVAALPQRFSTEVSFVNGINSALRGREVVQSGASVTASNLYRMLGAGLHFEEWNCGMYTKNSQHFRDHRVNLPSTTTEDYWIPLTLACEIAAKESDFAGKLTLCLLSEGGYLHGGAIDEPANATLERFRGLVPDDMGRVRISKIWEFMNQKEALKEWFNHRAFLLWKYARTSFGYMVDVRSPWCGEIWETIFSEMYDPVLKLSSPVL